MDLCTFTQSSTVILSIAAAIYKEKGDSSSDKETEEP